MRAGFILLSPCSIPRSSYSQTLLLPAPLCSETDHTDTCCRAPDHQIPTSKFTLMFGSIRGTRPPRPSCLFPHPGPPPALHHPDLPPHGEAGGPQWPGDAGQDEEVPLLWEAGPTSPPTRRRPTTSCRGTCPTLPRTASRGWWSYPRCTCLRCPGQWTTI